MNTDPQKLVYGVSNRLGLHNPVELSMTRSLVSKYMVLLSASIHHVFRLNVASPQSLGILIQQLLWLLRPLSTSHPTLPPFFSRAHTPTQTINTSRYILKNTPLRHFQYRKDPMEVYP
ncbi:14005_t:CDS:1, partial [Entrophospora sp. SA101]